METIKTKKVKVSDSPGAVDESNNNSTNKLITKLNHECLGKIFMHLPVEERLEMVKVCKKWKEAVDSSWYTVKKLELDDLMIPLDKKEETLKMLMIKCGSYLTHLTITDDQYPWMSSLLKDNCKNIINFTIDINKIDDKWKISEEDLVEIIGSMKKLKYFKVEMNLAKSRDLAYKIVNKLPYDIHEIHLISKEKDCCEIETTNPILKRFKSLRCLTLDGFELTNKTLNDILQKKKLLTKLDLSYCAFPSDAPSIFKNLKNLEHLNLTWVKNLSFYEVTSIARSCLKLKHLEVDIMKLSGSIQEIPYCVYRQLKKLNLEYLKIERIDKYGDEDEDLLADMTENWQQIKHLDLSGARGYTNDDLQEIPKLNNLEYVNLWGANVDSELFVKIANNCLKLKKINIFMRGISETALFELSNLKKIEKLYFFENYNLTGNLLGHIADNCKNLVHLQLNSCNITEDSLIKVGKLEHLTELYITDIKNVPNAMFFNFKKLEELSCPRCPSVSDEGIKKVLDNCQKLNCLNLRGTGVTVESLVHAEKRKFVFKLLRIFVNSNVKNEYEAMCESTLGNSLLNIDD